MLITKTEAEQLLTPYADRLLTVFNQAWGDWLSRIKENPSCCKRGRSNFIWDQIIHHAKNEFKIEPDHQFAIYPYNNNLTYNFIIQQKLVFRIKKGRTSRRSSNIPTNMALGFHDPNEALPEIGLLPRIEIQYELDKHESSIIDIVAVARDKQIIAWDFSLKYLGNAELPINPTIPVNPQTPSIQTISTVKKRVKLKSVKPEKERKKIVGE
ncbi:hypothetical protein KW868_13470 [Acinetobacter guillouiae]|uniref:Uncharacterized protein n=1 Tax=Acinetobacter guillouiae TaxID=106649 RepID=A0A8X8KFV9_ACIGI|nr:hypothetical protein [Acinetobacter guillouiae]MCF0265460.1 hypothetical protein [Acinetobacter guillouiae]